MTAILLENKSHGARSAGNLAMKYSTLPRMLFVTMAGAVAKQLPNASDKAILDSFKARGVRVGQNAVLDLAANGRIDYVEVSFDKKSWDAASDL